MPKTLTAVFFDVDDTLFDRERAQHEIVARMMAEFPELFAGLDREQVVAAFLESDRLTLQEVTAGLPAERWRMRRTEIFLGSLGLGDNHCRELTEMYVNLYPTLDTPVNGARQVVESLARHYRLGVISNGLADVQYKKLRALGIRESFDCVVLSHELGIEKPSPDIFLHAVSQMGVRPGESLYVGDSYETDVVGAKTAGLAACWFNPSGTERPVSEPSPDLEVQALDQIPNALRSTQT